MQTKIKPYGVRKLRLSIGSTYSVPPGKERNVRGFADNMNKLFKPQYMIIAAVIFTLCLLPCIERADAGIKSNMKFVDGRLTLEADQTPLFQLLEVISKSAGVDVYVSKGLSPGNVSARISDQPLDDALKSILLGFNYAAIYTKKGDEFRISAIKIYAEGQQGGEVVPLYTGNSTTVYSENGLRGETRTVFVSSTGEIITKGGLEKKGVLAPSQTELNTDTVGQGTLQSPWFATKVQLEQQEMEKFQELQKLQKQLESTDDPDRKKALTMIYTDETAKFYEMKKANLNKVESMKRITQFGEITGQ